jgi:hypothetical protein
MKPKTLSAFLSLLVILVVSLTTFLPVPISSADPHIELSRTAGSVGSMFNVRGYDFTKGNYYYIFFGTTYLDSSTVNDQGEFTSSITIPDIAGKPYYVITAATSQDKLSRPDFDFEFDETAAANFEVKDIYLKLKADNGTVSNPIEINGYGFTKDYYYYVFFKETYKGTGIVDSSGTFSKSITTPSQPAGFYEISVMASKSSNSSPKYTSDYDESAIAQFEIVIQGSISIDDSSGNVGDTFKLNGSFFSPGKKTTVYWDGEKIGDTFTSSSSGTFEDQEYKVPETTYGPHSIKVVDSSRTFGALSYSVTPKITLSSPSVTGANPITVSGTGFKASSIITFSVDGTALNTTLSTSVLGTLSSTSITITNVSSGSHVLRVQDGAGNSASKNIEVSSPVTIQTPTPTPTSTPTPTPTKSTTPVQTTTATTSVISTTTSPTQTTTVPQPSSTSSSSGIPGWAIVVIIITGIIILVVIVLLTRKSTPKNKP